MSSTRDPGKFFQTDDSLAEQKRKANKSRNTNGQPIKLPSKILAVIAEPGSKGAVYVAESSGLARKVDLVTNSTRHTFTGASAPLTCLALSSPTTRTSAPTLFAGCWDRSIWSWNTSSRDREVHFRNGHRDFVKCLVWTLVGNVSVLISGSADTTIVLWDATNGAKLQLLQGHSMAVAALAVDPFLGFEDEEDEDRNEGGQDQKNEQAKDQKSTTSASTTSKTKKPTPQPRTLFSASARSINQWTLIPTPSNPLSKLTAAASPDVSGPLTPAEGSIYALTFPHATPSNPDPNLWLASADGTILSLDRHDEWHTSEAETLSTTQGHHVRALALSEDSRFLAAAGRDEDVYIWDMQAGTSKAETKLLSRSEGHFDEVVGLTILGKGVETRVVSVSLDCTLRTWSLAGVFAPKDAEAEDINYTNRIMAGNEFDNAGIIAGGADSPVLEEGNPDDVAVQLGITASELQELGDMLEDDHHNDFYG